MKQTASVHFISPNVILLQFKVECLEQSKNSKQDRT